MPLCKVCGKPRTTMTVSHQVPLTGHFAKFHKTVAEPVCRKCQRFLRKQGVRL